MIRWDISSPAGTTDKWVQTTDFSTEAPSTSTITMTADLTNEIFVGTPIRFVLNSSTYYARCSAITSNLLTIEGAPLTTGGGDLQELYYDSINGSIQRDFYVAAFYGSAVDNNLLNTIMLSQFVYDGKKAYIVGFNASHYQEDTSLTNPKVNLYINGNPLSTNDTNNGIQLSTQNTRVNNPNVDINTTYYEINKGDIISPGCTVVGANGDAAELTMSVAIVEV